jgi:hypothetical protein
VNEIDPDRLPGEDAELLPANARARSDTFMSAVVELVSASEDEGLDAGARAVHQIMRGLDAKQYADALHLPEDAGEFADALPGMLVRIPDGWGRWIRCERGWHPLLAELDAKLAVLLPRYQIHQVKEKFGGLRFYWHIGERIVAATRSPQPSGRKRTQPRRRARSPSTRRGSDGSRRISKRSRPKRDRRICLVGSSSPRVSLDAPKRSRRGRASGAAGPASAASVATEPGTRRYAPPARMPRATNPCLMMTTTSRRGLGGATDRRA